MDTATGNQAKRQRTSTPEQESQPTILEIFSQQSQDVDTPSTKPKAFTYESLSPAIKSFADTNSAKFSKLLSELHRFKTNQKKFNSAAFIPKSANFKFQLNSSKAVRDSDAYATAKQEIANSIANTQSSIRNQLTNMATLECTRIETEMAKLFFQASQGLALLLLIQKDYTWVSPPSKTLLLLCLERYTKILKRHLPFDENTVFTKYKELADTTSDLHTRGSISLDDAEPVKREISMLFSILKEMFVTKQDRFLDKCKEKATEAVLLKTCRQLQATSSTKATSTALDLEESIDKSTIIDLINDTVNNKIKSLQHKNYRQSQQQKQQKGKQQVQGGKEKEKEIEKDKGKNLTRGATKHGASKQKRNLKTDQQQAPPPAIKKTSKKQLNDDSADDEDNATSKSATSQKNKLSKNSLTKRTGRKPNDKKVSFEKKKKY
jgi:hypothetical protein